MQYTDWLQINGVIRMGNNKTKEMIQFYNYTRNGSEPKYYTMSKFGNFVYSHKDDQKEQEEFEKVYHEPTTSGELRELNKKYKVIDWELTQAKLKQAPGKMRETTNTQGL